MSQCHAQGRLGYTLNNLSLESLLQLMNHLEPSDPLLQGESRQVIDNRINSFIKSGETSDKS